MNGTDFLADTNAVIYLLSGNNYMKPYLQKTLAVSVISFMELLSFPGITGDEEKMIRQFLNMRKIIQIDKDVMEKTISDEAIEKLRDECKERRVYFDARTKIHLKEYLDSRDDMNPALFVTLDAPHDRLKISGVEIRLRNLVKKVGLNKIQEPKSWLILHS